MQRLDFSKCRTYATHANAVRAAENLVAKIHEDDLRQFPCRYLIHATDDGRFVPVFVGQGAATLGLHFHYPICN